MEPVSSQDLNGQRVAEQLRRYLDAIRGQSDASPATDDFGLHLDNVSRSYWPGLFHCYDVLDLPRTHNEIESLFRDTGRQVLRITGQKGLTGRTLQRQGAWELLAETGGGGQAARWIEPDSIGGFGSEAATLCSASRAIPLAESIDSSNPNSICSTASEVGSVTLYRHRVTFALLPFDLYAQRQH